ncbi:MAG TPA: Type 1 glutamine amidotransferase-like domain-containing protein [Candidatus Limnocylindrales bacterium]
MKPAGRIALHGGGEFGPGDEPFLDAIVRAAARGDRAVRVVVVPTAAARSGPETAARNGVRALRAAARRIGREAETEIALVVDRPSADERANVELLEAADLVYLPGGHPDLIPAVLPETRAWRAMLAAHDAGAVITGASAGAMGLASRSWTPGGWVPALGLVPGLIVVPHFAMIEPNIAAWAPTIDELDGLGLGALALDERTGVLSPAGGDTHRWEVVGEGRAAWFGVGAGQPVVARHGQTLDIAAATVS